MRVKTEKPGRARPAQQGDGSTAGGRDDVTEL
jgi:hypothetical protein